MSSIVEDAIKEHHQFAYEKDRENINYQPYRTTPLIMPGAKVKRDNPINSCYLSLHPDPQVRGRATHMQVTPSLNNMLHQANQQLAKKVASTANYLPMRDATDSYSGPRVVHHQFNTPINLYSNNNASQALQDRTGINTSVDGGPRKEFNIQSSAALKAILEDGAGRPAAVSQPRSHVHYDQHEAKGGVWPLPEHEEQRTLPPQSERPVRKVVEQPKRDLPVSPTQDGGFQGSIRTMNEKIAQSYSFNKVMYACVDPLERL